jgi:hypothetical protein
VNEDCRDFEIQLKEKKNKKLSRLLESKNKVCQMSGFSDNDVHNFHPRLINCSKMELSKEEEALLEKGLKHSLQPFNVDNALTNVVADLTVKIGPGVNIQKRCVETIRNTQIQCIDNNTRTVVKKLRKKIIEEEVIITKADKGNAIVLMERASYEEKVMEVLRKMGAQRSDEFNFPAHVKEVRKSINGSKNLIKNPVMKKSLLIPNPVPPFCMACLKCTKMMSLCGLLSRSSPPLLICWQNFWISGLNPMLTSSPHIL